MGQVFGQFMGQKLANVMATDDGGLAIKLRNGTGAPTIKGMLVTIDPSNDLTVIAAPMDGTVGFGVFLEEGIPDGQDAWVVVAGIARVAVTDKVAVPGDYLRISHSGGADDVAAVQEVVTFTVTHAAVAAGNVLVKIPGIAAVSIAIAALDVVNDIATKIAAGTYAGWTTLAVANAVTFTQTIAATTDGLASFDPAGTSVTATVIISPYGNPAIPAEDGIPIAIATLPLPGEMVGIVLEDHTSPLYAGTYDTVRTLLKTE